MYMPAAPFLPLQGCVFSGALSPITRKTLGLGRGWADGASSLVPATDLLVSCPHSCTLPSRPCGGRSGKKKNGIGKMVALEKEMATHSSLLARRIPGTEEPVGLLSMGSHRVGHD